MEHEVIGSNLRRLRKSKDLTQQQLAEEAGLSRVGYRNIETGKSAPRVETLQSLAGALEVPVQDLVSRVHQLKQVRFRSLKRLRSRDQILAEVSQKLSDVNQLEEALDDRRPFALSGAAESLSGKGKIRSVAAASALRSAFGLRDDEPVRDICGLLEANGVKVFSISLASNDFFGLSVGPEDGGPAIVVNTWDRISVERWIFSAAHELGHLILHLDGYDVAEAGEDRQQEKEADVFASHFLMPQPIFQKEWDETYGLPLVMTVLYRLKESNPKMNVWQLFQNAYRQRFGRTLARTDEPDALDAADYRAGAPEPQRAGEPSRLAAEDFLQDRLWNLVRRGVESGHISLSRGAEILDIPLGEMRAASRGWVGSL
jgi:Zn-dependent peptidase ImmA (M78 family)/DNA-binding XRE family transcriptional regulator